VRKGTEFIKIEFVQNNFTLGIYFDDNRATERSVNELPIRRQLKVHEFVIFVDFVKRVWAKKHYNKKKNCWL